MATVVFSEAMCYSRLWPLFGTATRQPDCTFAHDHFSVDTGALGRHVPSSRPGLFRVMKVLLLSDVILHRASRCASNINPPCGVLGGSQPLMSLSMSHPILSLY